MSAYLVIAGERAFKIEAADSAWGAIRIVKDRIGRRGLHSDEIGMSLVQSLENKSLPFLVFLLDGGGNSVCVVGGELDGRYEEPVSRALVEKFSHKIPEALMPRGIDLDIVWIRVAAVRALPVESCVDVTGRNGGCTIAALQREY